MTTLPRASPAPSADPRFVRRDRREILLVLRRLIGEERPVLVSYGGEGEVVHTTVLDLSDDQRTVFLEWGPDDATSERVIASGTVSCQAELDRVRLQFPIEPSLGRLRYHKVFRAPLPELMVRLQRREYYRLPIGPDDRVACSLLLPHPDGHTRPTDVEIVDLSGGGLAFRVPLSLGAQLRLHVELAGCTLALADAGTLTTRVRVCNLTKVADDERGTWVRVGAQFLDLRAGHIAQVQRFIGFIERRRRHEERRRAELAARVAAVRAAMARAAMAERRGPR